MQWGTGWLDFFSPPFFKSARNVFNKEEVNYDNYSEWLDPWALLISIYCLDYRTIQVKPNRGCSFTFKAWKGTGGRGPQQPPPWCSRRQPTSPQPADSLLVETHPYWPQRGRPIHLFCVLGSCLHGLWGSGDWSRAKYFAHHAVWGRCYQLGALSNKELKLRAPWKYGILPKKYLT